MRQVHGMKAVTPYPGRPAGRLENSKHCYALKTVLSRQESADAVVVKKLL
jgi:hypothetical protein